MYLVKKSLVTPMTVFEVKARLDADLPLRTEAEKVLKAAPCLSPLWAECVFRAWKKHADVRAGRARVRIVEIPEKAAAVEQIGARDD